MIHTHTSILTYFILAFVHVLTTVEVSPAWLTLAGEPIPLLNTRTIVGTQVGGAKHKLSVALLA